MVVVLHGAVAAQLVMLMLVGDSERGSKQSMRRRIAGTAHESAQRRIIVSVL
jgi:hypothetical protein